MLNICKRPAAAGDGPEISNCCGPRSAAEGSVPIGRCRSGCGCRRVSPQPRPLVPQVPDAFPDGLCGNTRCTGSLSSHRSYVPTPAPRRADAVPGSCACGSCPVPPRRRTGGRTISLGTQNRFTRLGRDELPPRVHVAARMDDPPWLRSCDPRVACGHRPRRCRERCQVGIHVRVLVRQRPVKDVVRRQLVQARVQPGVTGGRTAIICLPWFRRLAVSPKCDRPADRFFLFAQRVARQQQHAACRRSDRIVCRSNKSHICQKSGSSTSTLILIRSLSVLRLGNQPHCANQSC